MNNLIAIIAGDPNSINSEIIAKAWIKKKKFKKIFIIGNYSILKKQIIKLGIEVPIVKINKLEDIGKERKLFILDVPLKFKSLFSINLSNIKLYGVFGEQELADFPSRISTRKNGARKFPCFQSSFGKVIFVALA